MNIIAWDLENDVAVMPERTPEVGEHARHVQGERVWFGEYHPLPVYTDQEIAEEEGRMWRNIELASTDMASQTPDWPNRANILAYRTALRDWPSTSEFPATRPEL